MYKLCVFIPASHLESVKSALFEQGAGRIGDYDCCSWQTLGEGQFRPLKGAKPYIGEINEVETVSEYKVEMVVDNACIKGVLKALFTAHPYEEPAFDVLSLTDPNDFI